MYKKVKTGKGGTERRKIDLSKNAKHGSRINRLLAVHLKRYLK